jgi:alcohol dehydrogenase (cytochrome c)
VSSHFGFLLLRVLSSARMRTFALAVIAAVFALSLHDVSASRQTPRTTAAETGGRLFEQFCSTCHGADGRGGERGPNIIHRLVFRNDRDLAALIHDGLPSAGMPGIALPSDSAASLVKFVRQLQAEEGVTRPRVTLETLKGASVEGVALNRGEDDVQVLSDDGRVRLLRKVGTRVREVTSDADWPTYHGEPGGNRFSMLDRINRANVASLAPAWVFPLAGSSRLEVTPVVVGGIMYVTSVNECVALDAGNGREIWRFKRPRTKGLAGDAAGGINRGVAVAGDRLFMVTDHAHLLALNRFTGMVLWESTMADWRENYGATSAPLALGRLVVSGTSGGDEGIRGFLAAFDQATGKEVWRVWTVPARGEPGSETWKGKDIDHPCASAWLTGTYDRELDVLYWPTGNPCPDYDGSERIGDNLYSDSVLAIHATSGKLAWYFQYTPHDVWDWDSQQTPMLVDASWAGQPRKLLLHANRNGFFYVLDRTNGALLLAKPFVKALTWASGISPAGRPMLNPNQQPSKGGTRVCPAVEGATNWFSTSFNPATGFYYVQTLEKCNIYSTSPQVWQAGRSYYSGSTKNVPGEPGQKVLRAIDVLTGSIAWEVPQTGPADSWGGTLSTAGGLVFYGDDSGAFAAVDAKTGERLWRFPANVLWKASPMTYSFDGRQFVAIAAGSTIIAFATPLQ